MQQLTNVLEVSHFMKDLRFDVIVRCLLKIEKQRRSELYALIHVHRASQFREVLLTSTSL